MTKPAKHAGPDLKTLFGLFPQSDQMPEVEYVPDDEVPPPYHDLLVHDQHMTVTVEAYHGSLVDVRVLEQRDDGDLYARKILLTLQNSGKVVQFGIVRVHLNFCSAEVRDAIVAGMTPLGRILIEHDVMRRIEPTAYLRVIPGPAMMNWFGHERSRPTYGRLAIIHCDEQPAIELLEIVVPV